MQKAISKKQKRVAKKAFAKPSHTTRPFTHADYKALPSKP